MLRSLRWFALSIIAATALVAHPLAAQSANEWTAYGRDASGTRDSPLTQITRDNVTRLSVAWTYRTGAKAWDVPLGDPASLRPGSAVAAATPLGLPNLGGAIVTASGLTFIAATFDHYLRAFDTATGAELWRGELPAGARATPMTYAVGGRQYVVICVGGGDELGRGDYVVAFAVAG